MSEPAPCPLWPGAYAAATAVFGLATIAALFWPAARAGLAALCLLLLVAGTAAGSGRAAAAALGLRCEDEAAKTVVAASLGLGLLSLAMLALAALHLLRPWAVCAVLALFWVAGFSQLRAALSCLRLPQDWRERPLAAAAVLVPLAAALWLCFVPPHQYDSLVYHLALPQAYLRDGGLAPAEHLIFSHFPQNGEMLFALALALGSDLLAQMLMWLATALSMAWVWTMTEGELPAPARLLACFLLATHTAVLLMASTTYVEPLVMLWVTAAALCLWRGRDSRPWLVLSAVFAGLALGAKYSAGCAVGAMALMLLWRRAKDLVIFGGTATAVFLPWLVKNALETGDPVFPFFYGSFAATSSGFPAASAQRYFSVLSEYRIGSLGELALLPFQLLSSSPRFGGGMDAVGTMGWELLFWSMPLALWAALTDPSRKLARWLLALCALAFAAWCATGVVLRFLTAFAPIMCLLAGLGLWALWERLGRGGRAALAAGAGLLILAHVLLFEHAHAVFGSERSLLGLESRQEFLSRRLDYYPCGAWAGEHLGRNDRILIVGEQRGYYVAQSRAATTVNSPNRYVEWAEAAESPVAFAGRLKAEGFGYVLTVPREARRLAPALEPVSERGSRNWSGLEPDWVEPVFQGPACTLYQLK